jgi:PAS domain S-box-containing protein
MKKKTKTSSRSSKGKALPSVRPARKKPEQRKEPPLKKTFWQDDKLFRALIEDSSDAFSLTDSRGNILYRSPSAKIISGFSDKDIHSVNLFDRIWPEDLKIARRDFAEMIKNPGRKVAFQIRVKDKTGNPRWMDGTGVNWLAEPGLQALVFHFRDLTEQKLSANALEYSEKRYRNLFENARLAIFQCTPEGKILRVNNEFARMFGYLSPEDVFESVKDTGTDIYADPSRRREIIRLQKNDPALSLFESLFRRKDGSTFWGRSYMRSATDSQGTISYFEGFIEDITKSRALEEALRESEEKYRLLFELSPDSIAVYLDGKIIFANPATARLLGAGSPQELIGRPMLEFVHPDYRKLVMDRSRQQEREGRPVPVVEEKFVKVDGSAIDVDVTAAPIQYLGKTAHLVICRDITERKRIGEALRESEERYRSLFANSLEGMGLSKGNRIIDANKATLEIFGYENLKEFVALPLLDHVAPESREPIREYLQKAQKGEVDERRFTYKIIRKNGEKRDVEISVEHLKLGNEIYTQSTFRDVTDRIRTEEALREKEDRFRATFDNANVGVCVVGLDGRLLQVNRQMCAIFGYTREELEQMNVNTITHPEDADISQTFIHRAVSGEGDQAGFDKRYIHKDGHILWGNVSSSLIRDAQGAPLYFISHVQDVTDRKRAEEELRALVFRHEALLSAIPEIVMEVDKNKAYRWANPAGKEFFGEDVIGKEAAYYFEGEQATYTAVQPLFSGSEDTIYVESWQRRKDGQKRLLAWWCRTLKDGCGNVTGALSSARDVTEQKLAGEQIQILSRFPMENPNPVMRIAPDGGLLYANPSSQPFMMKWNIQVGQTVPDEFRALIGEVFAANRNKEIDMECGERIFLCTLTPVASEGYVNLYGRDITDRKKVEGSLFRQAEELRQRNLELARLNELTERRMQQLAAMRTVDMAISSSFKSELVMDILLEQLTSQLRVHAADILIFHPAMQGFRFFCGRGFYSPPASHEYLRLTDSYAGRATQERRMVKVPHLDEKKDGSKIFPKIAKEGFVFYACLPLISKGQIKGVMEICHRDALELSPEEDSFLEMLAGQAAIAIDNAEMFEHLQSSRDELQLAFNSTLAGWARALELRDRESEGETQRGADLAMRLAQILGESENDLTNIYRGAILHDVGMMSVPDGILLKPGPLTGEEWTIVRRHPQIAFDILSPVLFLRPALDIPHSHHEQWDGSGYPLGSRGEHIPLAGRIFAVVDAWNALRSDRPYRKAWTELKAGEYIRSQAGKHFDPAAVQAFFRLIGGH